MIILALSGEQLVNCYERVRQTRKENFKRRWYELFANADNVVHVFEVMFTQLVQRKILCRVHIEPSVLLFDAVDCSQRLDCGCL